MFFTAKLQFVKKLSNVNKFSTYFLPTYCTSVHVYWASLCDLMYFLMSLLYSIVIDFLRPLTRLFLLVFFYSRYRTVKVLNALGSPFLTPVGTPDTMSESGSVKSARSRRSVPAFSNLLSHLLCYMCLGNSESLCILLQLFFYFSLPCILFHCHSW